MFISHILGFLRWMSKKCFCVFFFFFFLITCFNKNEIEKKREADEQVSLFFVTLPD